MKQLSFAVACILLLIAASIVNLGCLHRTTDRVSALVVRGEESALHGSLDEALAQTVEARQEWNRSLPYLSSVMPHDELDDVTIVFSKCAGALQARSYELYMENVSALKDLLGHLTDMERFAVENIL